MRSWWVRHFCQGNPQGPGQGDVPALLRRVAASIEELGAGADVQDIVYQKDVDSPEDWPRLTVYFHLPSDDETRPLRPVE
jgi:hypothetical protein